MVNAQVVRDVWMAQALRNNARTGAVLIADNGHVRRDIGAARWLSAFDVANIQAHGYIERGSVTDDFAYDTIHAIALITVLIHAVQLSCRPRQPLSGQPAQRREK